MKIGSFEEIVLLATGALGDEAYGASIRDLLQENMGKVSSIGALHSALYRLEEKGFATSFEGGVTAERGGRRKKFYRLTVKGRKALEETQALRIRFARQIPGINYGFP